MKIEPGMILCEHNHGGMGGAYWWLVKSRTTGGFVVLAQMSAKQTPYWENDPQAGDETPLAADRGHSVRRKIRAFVDGREYVRTHVGSGFAAAVPWDGKPVQYYPD